MRWTAMNETVQDLWTRWRRDRDLDARDGLIRHYLPQVEVEARKVAKTIPPSSRPDLFSFGVIGLMDAIDKFRPELGYRFETYCPFRIRGAIKDGVRVLAWLPRRAAQRKSRIIEKVVPVDFQAAWDDTNRVFDAILFDPIEETPLDNLLLEADHAEVNAAIATLPERERKVVVDYYYGSRRLADIGKDLGVTESRACQMHRRALALLKRRLMEPLSA